MAHQWMFLIVLCICLGLCSSSPLANTIPADNPFILYSGRTVASNGMVSFDWSGVEFTFSFQGTSVGLTFSGGPSNEYNVFVDGVFASVISITTNNENTYPAASGLSDTVHKLTVTKRTEAFFGVQVLIAVVLEDGKQIVPTTPLPMRRLEFIGDSITCGYGDEGTFPCTFSPQTENNFKAYGALVANHFQADLTVTCWSGKGLVRNYGDRNPTSVDPFPIYYNRTEASNNNSPIWNFKERIPTAVVINLGTNDYSTQPSPPSNIFIPAFLEFIRVIRAHYERDLPVFLACGPLIGDPCCQYVQQVVTQSVGVYYMGMTNILTQADLGCDYHPNVNGHLKMANIAIPIIGNALNWQ